MHQHRVHPGVYRALERTAKVPRLIDSEPERFDSGLLRGSFSRLDLGLVQMRVVKQLHLADPRQYFPDRLNPFARDFRRIEKDAGDVAAGTIEALRRPGGN